MVQLYGSNRGISKGFGPLYESLYGPPLAAFPPKRPGAKGLRKSPESLFRWFWPKTRVPAPWANCRFFAQML